MKNLSFKLGNTNLIGHFDTNDYGVQFVKVVKEHLDGTKETIFTEVNQEGNWRSLESLGQLLKIDNDESRISRHYGFTFEEDLLMFL